MFPVPYSLFLRQRFQHRLRQAARGAAVGHRLLGHATGGIDEEELEVAGADAVLGPQQGEQPVGAQRESLEPT